MSIASMPNAEGDTPATNLSFEELIAQRAARYSQPEEAPPVEQAEEPETTEAEEEIPATEEVEGDEAETEGDESEDQEQHDEIDLLNLTPEQIQQLAKKAKSRLLSDVSRLRAENRNLAAQLNQTQAEAKPLQRQIPAEENPFRALTTLNEIQAKFTEFEKVAEETDRILEEHEEYGADDIITLDGQEFTKKAIRTANRNARNAMAKFLPAQATQIQKIEQLQAMAQQYETVTSQEVPEVADAESPIGKQYQSLIADPLIAQVKERVPDLAPQINYILAHALRSMNSKAATKTPTAAAKPQPKVAGNPFGAAGPRSAAPPASKAAGQAQQQFEQSGRIEDLIAARAARHSITR